MTFIEWAQANKLLFFVCVLIPFLMVWFTFAGGLVGTVLGVLLGYGLAYSVYKRQTRRTGR
jgi:ABC-type lipoprotein release transport system permease subunit